MTNTALGAFAKHEWHEHEKHEERKEEAAYEAGVHQGKLRSGRTTIKASEADGLISFVETKPKHNHTMVATKNSREEVTVEIMVMVGGWLSIQVVVVE